MSKMSTRVLSAADAAAAPFDRVRPGVFEVTPDAGEIARLLDANVWPTADRVADWTIEAADGSVWAGRCAPMDGSFVAKLRYKHGRRSGAGRPMEGDKAKPVSFTLRRDARAALAALVAKSGKKRSAVVEELILAARP